jgi:large subunit ribosomal protein L24e
MAKCSFCNKALDKGIGTLYVQKTGKLRYYCSSKCEKNERKLKRKPTKIKWTRKPKKKK